LGPYAMLHSLTIWQTKAQCIFNVLAATIDHNF
jgi:hypothetical protein